MHLSQKKNLRLGFVEKHHKLLLQRCHVTTLKLKRSHKYCTHSFSRAHTPAHTLSHTLTHTPRAAAQLGFNGLFKAPRLNSVIKPIWALIPLSSSAGCRGFTTGNLQTNRFSCFHFNTKSFGKKKKGGGGLEISNASKSTLINLCWLRPGSLKGTRNPSHAASITKQNEHVFPPKAQALDSPLSIYGKSNSSCFYMHQQLFCQIWRQTRRQNLIFCRIWSAIKKKTKKEND